LLGLSDQPGELAGYGPITAHVARQHADIAATWHRLITDPLGQLLDHPTRSYHPPPALAAHVTARDNTCRWPGCHRPAHRCHLDHRLPWPKGPTSSSNLGPLCSRDHHLKHRSGWKVEPAQPGEHPATVHWTSRTGRTYTKHPHRHPTSHSDAGIGGGDGGTPGDGGDHNHPTRNTQHHGTGTRGDQTEHGNRSRETTRNLNEGHDPADASTRPAPKSDLDLGPPPF
jgi:hypothetical protein